MSKELRNRSRRGFTLPSAPAPGKKRLTPKRAVYSSGHISWQQHDVDRINRIMATMGTLPVDHTKLVRGALLLASKKGSKGFLELIVDVELDHMDQSSDIRKRYGLREFEKARLKEIRDKVEAATGKRLKNNRIIRGGLALAEHLKPRELFEVIKAAEKESLLYKWE